MQATTKYQHLEFPGEVPESPKAFLMIFTIGFDACEAFAAARDGQHSNTRKYLKKWESSRKF
ncbi:MAG: hypothetical protein J5846_01380 [Desulfovibrio sp.]|nr:hypothetical protein [Desulfovibrio sp.]